MLLPFPLLIFLNPSDLADSKLFILNLRMCFMMRYEIDKVPNKSTNPETAKPIPKFVPLGIK